jgi:coenzyme F420-reducing hydrogenase beta subunit
MKDKALPIAYGCKHRDDEIRIQSRSGGVFTAVSDIVLDNGGIVYGCALDDNFRAVHARAVTKQQRDEFRKSKYVQSDMGDSLRSVKQDLDGGLTVLFSGTPCQVDGLLSFLSLTKTDASRLLTMDIVCHGVPSPKLWRDYLAFQSKKHGKILSADFRNKRDFGWAEHTETLTTERGKVSSQIYKNLYFTDYALRRSCHECKYASKQRVSDITLADFWGIDSLDSSFNDNRGVSLVLVNTEKGLEAFNKALESNALEAKAFDIERVDQKALREPFYYSYKKEAFWQDYREKGFDYIVRKYGEKSPVKKAVERLAARFV